MPSAEPVVWMSSQGPPSSSAAAYLSQYAKAEDSGTPEPSPLLRTIRRALRGSDTELVTKIQTSTFSCQSDPYPRELAWNAHTVIVSRGGVMVKKWNFTEEGESIQWACLGELEQHVSVASTSTHRSANYTMGDFTHCAPSGHVSGQPTFGPFARKHVKPELAQVRKVLFPAVFVFLRSIGRIFLQNGSDYTFSLPFIVRKAWPISPYGVMIQRVLEPGELVEAENTGDAVLPTIFSVTSPFAEAAAVGLTSGIIGNHLNVPPTLLDEDENSSRPLKSIPPTEMVIWTSHRSSISTDDVVVTVDVSKQQLSIWHYAYVKPKDTPIPFGRTHPRAETKPRQSTVHRGRNSSIGMTELSGRIDRLHPLSPKLQSAGSSPTLEFFDLPDAPPLSAFPGMVPSLSRTAATMQSLVTGTSSSQQSATTKGRRNSLTRNDLSITMDRMVLGGKLDSDIVLAPIEYGRMKAAYWMQRVYSEEISESDAVAWRMASVSLFDSRWDGNVHRTLMAVCFPRSQALSIFSLSFGEDRMMKTFPLKKISAVAITSICATRQHVWDLLFVKPEGTVSLLTHGLQELAIGIKPASESFPESANIISVHTSPHDQFMVVDHGKIVSVQGSLSSNAVLTYDDGWQNSVTFALYPRDLLTTECLLLLALTLPGPVSFQLHVGFMKTWASHGLSTEGTIEFQCFIHALYKFFSIDFNMWPQPTNSWKKLGYSMTHRKFSGDPVMKLLKGPLSRRLYQPPQPPQPPNLFLVPILYALHTLAENLRLLVTRYNSVTLLAPVICRIAIMVRPEWADYWKRLVPEAIPFWPSPAATEPSNLNDRIPVWPLDFSAMLYGRISRPDWHVARYDTSSIPSSFHIKPSFEYGSIDPLLELHDLTDIYQCLADDKYDVKQRAEAAVLKMVQSKTYKILHFLPIGIAAPLWEAARTCQLAPPGNWPSAAYRAIGRNDLAASASNNTQDVLFNDGYRPKKYFLNPSRPRQLINGITMEARAAVAGEVDAVSGVELDLQSFTDIRFGQDRRLEEVARILCSSTVPTIKLVERSELSELDHAKENQNQVIRMAERTLALSYGRAMFTFGSTPTVTREAYTIPKIEYAIRITPMNTVVVPEAGKINAESISWGEFHNGVAAGLRISPTSKGVESSWIAFNKPSDLTPEHAGFLLGLGLTGHLKEMLTWHTFAYLTPKHDLTSIGVLLGLSAANVGSGNQHVTKLLAVHTPALLPTPDVDLNVSLVTQATGLAGLGLLYLGTRNRRMAELCLNQISRRDLVQPDLSNEHREAYTYSAALAFGMIMLGKGTTIPADMSILSRLSLLVHGDARKSSARQSFDINLTSPAATIALGLMYLRTERQDVADILTIPDTVLVLNRIQPNFLLIRTVARSLIMWNLIQPTNEWLMAQIPASIREAIDTRGKSGKGVDDSMELAYYNILAGCCFAVGLKFAGTARQEAYMMIVRYFDLFTRMVYVNGPAFDLKIKRSAVRDGLNVISISLSMVMAGTGEISCLRRFRYSYGMYQQAMNHHGNRYGVHVATHMSLGLLFLGGGRFTLGTSNAAIACMVVAFFPRFHHTSADNKSFLQALRHLWVLAVEPRCLIARDVDTGQVVYLPVKIAVQEGKEQERSQLISPTLIPDMDKLLSIRVDTPRYWPFYLDVAGVPRHKEGLLRSQTLYVKRRTAFLSYTEDPRGSRSLFVRSGSSAGDAAMLDFPQVTEENTHPAGDLSEFITSFSNDIIFQAFAEHFARADPDATPEERVLHNHAHAALLDAILQDKPQTLQTYLALYTARTMDVHSPYFHLKLADLCFATDFYDKVYERRFSGNAENCARPGLVREMTMLGALHVLDRRLDGVRVSRVLEEALGRYVRGEADVTLDEEERSVATRRGAARAGKEIDAQLAWYLLREGVPVSTLLTVLRELAHETHARCLPAVASSTSSGAGGADDALLTVGIKEVLLTTGTKMTTALGSGWSVRSLEEIIVLWKS